MSDLDADKAVIARVHLALNMLVAHAFTPLEVDDDGEVKCPWCFAVVKRNDSGNLLVTGWTGPHQENAYLEGTTLYANDDDRYLSNGMYYIVHTSCGNPVALPDGWSIEFD